MLVFQTEICQLPLQAITHKKNSKKLCKTEIKMVQVHSFVLYSTKVILLIKTKVDQSVMFVKKTFISERDTKKPENSHQKENKSKKLFFFVLRRKENLLKLYFC